MRKLKGYSLALLLVLLCSCRNGGKAPQGNQEPSSRPFPEPEVPGMVSDPSAAADYVAANFWKAFLDTSRIYRSDTTMVNGVSNDDAESAIGKYLTILEQSCPLEKAVKYISGFEQSLERFASVDTSSTFFPFFEKQVSRYLYDPNSPVRSEDLYLPFVSRLAESPLSTEAMRPAYAHDARMCALNRTGTRAADISFTDLHGKRHSLYGTKAAYTLLFFSNPGCPACKEITETLQASPKVAYMLEEGDLAVVNVYIDRELDKWREYASEYPDSWICGYDQDYRVRSDVTYNVRAIPSLYMLDSDKVVLLKDATTEAVMAFINGL